MSRPRKSPTPLSAVEGVIHTIRGERVILDADLAKLYGVETRALNQAVRCHRDKFSPDFLLEITPDEHEALMRSQIVTASSSQALRSQIVISKPGRGGRRYLPFAFTEHGPSWRPTS